MAESILWRALNIKIIYANDVPSEMGFGTSYLQARVRLDDLEVQPKPTLFPHLLMLLPVF